MFRAIVLFALAIAVVITVIVVVGDDGGNDAKVDAASSCDDGFHRAAWKTDTKDTGRAIANCDWLDGKPIASAVRALGKPDEPPYRGWYTWEIGSAPGIGPAAGDCVALGRTYRPASRLPLERC